MNEIFSISVGLIFLGLHIFLFLKVKSVILRLLPSIVLFLITVFFFIMLSLAKGWDALGYLVLGINTALVLLLCLLCWAVFGIIKLILRKKKSRQH